MVCIWDLGCKFQIEPTLDGRGQIVHPLIDITAQHGLCSSLAWCPLDPNFLCTGMEYLTTHTHTHTHTHTRTHTHTHTGGKDRAIHVWDIRQPITPIDTHQERGGLYNIVCVRLYYVVRSPVCVSAYTLYLATVCYEHVFSCVCLCACVCVYTYVPL